MNKQVLVFKICNDEFGLDIDNITQIITPVESTFIPDAPDYMEGVINFLDSVYVLINVRKKFGFPDKEQDEATRIVIVEKDKAKAGLIVDEAYNIISIDTIEGKPASSEIREKYGANVKSVIEKNNKEILLLDLDRFFQI